MSGEQWLRGCWFKSRQKHKHKEALRLFTVNSLLPPSSELNHLVCVCSRGLWRPCTVDYISFSQQNPCMQVSVIAGPDGTETTYTGDVDNISPSGGATRQPPANLSFSTRIELFQSVTQTPVICFNVVVSLSRCHFER